MRNLSVLAAFVLVAPAAHAGGALPSKRCQPSGHGTFGQPQLFVQPVDGRRGGPLVLEDINGDGILDVITIGGYIDNENRGRTTNRLSVWTSQCSP